MPTRVPAARTFSTLVIAGTLLLTSCGTIESGSDARALLASETVLINGEPDERRGRQLHHGDVVSVAGEELRVVVPGEDEQDTPAK